MNETLKIAEAVRHAMTTANQTVARLIAENDALYARLAQRDQLLWAVQTDPGNWLHQDLQDEIEALIGPAGPYRSLNDSGLPKETTT